MSKRLKKDIFRGTRFVPVGAITTLIDGAILAWLLLTWGREHALLANALGWFCGGVVNFTGHKLLTFFNLERKGWEPWRQYFLHLALKVFNLGVRTLAFYVFVVVLLWDWAMVSLGIIPLWNFFFVRWIFTGEPPWYLLRKLRIIARSLLCALNRRYLKAA